MNEFKFRFVNLLFFFLLLGSSYWAFQKMNPRFHYTASDVVEMIKDNEPLSGFENYQEDENTIQEIEQEKIQQVDDDSEEDSSPSTSSSDEKQEEKDDKKPAYDEEHQFLLTKLQGLIDDKIYMKKGSRGTRVGTVQKFLNLYFDKKIKVDNEYGPNTMYLVRKFQQKEGLSPDGLAGPETYEMMIDLIEKGKV